MDFRNYRNIHEMFKETVDRDPDRSALKWYTDDDQEHSLTWGRLYSQVRQVAQSLLVLGVTPGDKVSIVSQTCPHWVMCDLAITAIGACTVGIYPSNLPEECRHIIDHSDAVVVFAEDGTQLAKLHEIRKRIPAIRKVVLFRESPDDDDPWTMAWENFLKLGDSAGKKRLNAVIDQVGPQDPAGIIYTSGTTGVPKGAVLSHDNITFTAQSVLGCADFKTDDVMFLFLPLAHVFARTCYYTAVISGVTTVFSRRLETLAIDLKRAQPHWFVAVPRIFEKIYAKIIAGAEAKGGVTLKIFRWAHDVGLAAGAAQLARKPVPMALRIQYALASNLVFKKIRAAFGGRVRWCISGAAPLDPAIGKFFHACGILILEGLGMTENTSFSNVNRPQNYRFGWVGPPGPGIQQQITPDGEIQFRGRNVMQAYYKMPVESARAITPDGWLATGDMGEIDDQGFLKITGRKKEIIITGGGKNIAPARIEGLFATSAYINQILIVGDRRPYLTALVTLHVEAIARFADENQIAPAPGQELEAHPKILRLVETELTTINQSLASYETVKRLDIVPEFSIENGLLTPTMKLKKERIQAQYTARIDAMYREETNHGTSNQECGSKIF